MPHDATWDSWSLVHVATGAALGALRVGPVKALAALVAFEVFEAWARRGHEGGRGIFEEETRANIAGDIAAGALGWALARAL